jgi:non-canonical (house-cleaning) NTP pyrophosphatase
MLKLAYTEFNSIVIQDEEGNDLACSPSFDTPEEKKEHAVRLRKAFGEVEETTYGYRGTLGD